MEQHNARQLLRGYLTDFAEREGLVVSHKKGTLFIGGKEIAHGIDGQIFYADSELFIVDGYDARHVAAIFIAHLTYRADGSDGFNIQLEPEWYREEKRRG